MLRSLKKTPLNEVRTTHVDLFLEHYDSLRRWALHFTKHDQDLAQDLLHDVFIHLTLTRPKLEAVENLESYLYIVMRNLHLSQLRKSTRLQFRSLDVTEYDTVDVGLWASDPRDRMRLRDELSAVCDYACIRKETSRVGSILILRFFHGYYPEEIAAVLRSSRTAIDNRLVTARAEAKAYLEAPDRVAFVPQKEARAIKHLPLGTDLRLEFRQQIFSTRQRECSELEALKKNYQPDSDTVPTPLVAHIVACPTCIEHVNNILDLPPLATRYPLDTLGKDPSPKDKSGGGGTGGGGGTTMLDPYFSRRDVHYYHEPRELCVSVNGYLQGGHKVSADDNEMTLVLDGVGEELGFVEIFSEQGLRLLMLNVERPPAGDGEQAASVELSDGRVLAADLSFSGTSPVLQVSYSYPHAIEVAAMELSVPPAVAGGLSQHSDDSVPFASALTESNSFLDRLRGWFDPMKLAIASTLLVAVLAGIWFINQPVTTEPPTARAVLKQARDAEFAMAPTADKVLHRNYQIEVWANGELDSRRRVDEWEKQKGSARRTYDEQGRMIAGQWIAEDGKQQVFEQGQKLRRVLGAEQSSPPYETGAPAGASPRGVDVGGVAPASGDGVALSISPTANAFANLIDGHGVTARTTVEETPTAYTFNFEDRAGETVQTGINERLIAATLTLDRNTYMPTSQTIVLQIGGEQREYRFSDVRVEQRPVSEVSTLIFVPEAELSKGATVVTKPLEIELPTADLASKTATAANPAAASLDTEVEVFRALDSVNALSGDQITIERNAAGVVRVNGIVDSAQRKVEILNALSGLRNAPGLLINVQTAEEAAKARKQSNGTITPIDVDTTASTSTNLPVEDELKSHFQQKGISGENLNNQITTYASGVLNRSDSLRRNALSLKRLAERFSPDELQKLEPQKRDQWRALLRSKAAAVSGDARSLSAQLSAVGLGSGGGDGGGATIRDASAVAGAAQRLFGLGVECDAQVRQSFSISRGVAASASVKTVQFWRNLRQIEAIAGDIQRF